MTVRTANKFYLAGPMRGYRNFNFDAFDAAARELRLYGYEIISPAEIDRELGFDEKLNDLSFFEEIGGMKAAMHRDFQAIMESDGIILLPGWRESTGSRAEVFVAETTGRLVYEYREEQHDDGSFAGFSLVRISGSGIELASPCDDWPTPEPVEWSPEVIGGPFVSGGEVRVRNEQTGGEKGSKLARYDLIPAEPLRILAEHYGRGARKYEDRNWERGYDWSLSFAAMNRHLWSFWAGEDIDPETGSPHMAAVAWHAFLLLEFAVTHPDLDNRPCLTKQVP